jgi:soluble lytic murein transglycosylase-like protein
MTILDAVTIDKIFCLAAKEHRVERNLLKAVAIVESSLDQRAIRFEPTFLEWMKKQPTWPKYQDRDPNEIASSYGLMQIMYTTAENLDFEGPGEELFNPVLNIMLGAKLLRQLWDGLYEGKFKIAPHWKCWPQDVVLARYNGGFRGNPDENGMLRNYQYTVKVRNAYIKVLCEKQGCE